MNSQRIDADGALKMVSQIKVNWKLKKNKYTNQERLGSTEHTEIYNIA